MTRDYNAERWNTIYRHLEVRGRRQALIRYYASLLPEGRGIAIGKQSAPVKTLQVHFLGQLIEARKHLKLSQAELAKRAGLTRATVARIENGQHSPSLNTVFNLTTALELYVNVRSAHLL
jgi:DNA-binding XRE family transcriptional regulator